MSPFTSSNAFSAFIPLLTPVYPSHPYILSPYSISDVHSKKRVFSKASTFFCTSHNPFPHHLKKIFSSPETYVACLNSNELKKSLSSSSFSSSSSTPPPLLPSGSHDPSQESLSPLSPPFEHTLSSLSSSGKHFLQSFFQRSPYDKEILALAFPALLTLSMDPLMSVTDTFYVASLGTDALAGVGLSSAILKLPFSLFNFLAAVTTPLIAHAISSDDRQTVSRTIASSFWIAVVAGLILATLLYTLAEPLVSLFVLSSANTNTEIFNAGLAYLRIRALGAPAVLLSYLLAGSFRGIGDLKTPLIISVAVNVVNFLADPFFIYSCGWGVAGAAIATLIAQYISVLLSGVVLFIKKHIDLSHFRSIPSTETIKYFLYGSVYSARTAAIMMTFTLASVFSAQLGAVQIAAYEISRQLWLMQTFMLDSLAIAAQSMVARATASGNLRRTRDICCRILQCSIIAGTLLGVFTSLHQADLGGIFTTDPNVLGFSKQILSRFWLFQPICAVVFVFDGIYVAAKDYAYTAKSIVIAGLCACTFLIVSKAIVVDFSVANAWMGINVLTCGRAVASLIRFLWHDGPIPPYDRTNNFSPEETK